MRCRRVFSNKNVRCFVCGAWCLICLCVVRDILYDVVCVAGVRDRVCVCCCLNLFVLIAICCVMLYNVLFVVCVSRVVVLYVCFQSIIVCCL